jgi:hypothetical protein
MSLIKANDLQNASGGIPTVKGQKLIPTAWVNFKGTGTVSIRDSENVSSIADNATGKYTVNFAVAMANSNYAAQLSSDGIYNGSVCSFGQGDSDNTALSTGSVRVEVRGNGSSYNTYDATQMCVTILGGQ